MLPKTALGFALAGLLPFVLCPLLITLGSPVTLWRDVFTDYSAIILSFLGGIHWWHALQSPAPSPRQLPFAMLPSLVGLLALQLPQGLAWWLLMASFMLVLVADGLWLNWQRTYALMRIGISGVVVACHVWMIGLA
ncbi:DUF3429 domain-containing protein [Aestuariibacter halophilus]|uniref:DUF3429 domain-containing protein n=1 Tax=Fluctibacter halophilus TaxID=226011 RepID=A0ABS8G6K9_9ALTE|nr:DUF3429 domain-containing protein [Aestuariibacter halophilus]MCC2615480.1 DUF3429 domain-containing protein [Aestuariibacter halophilus]